MWKVQMPVGIEAIILYGDSLFVSVIALTAHRQLVTVRSHTHEYPVSFASKPPN